MSNAQRVGWVALGLLLGSLLAHGEATAQTLSLLGVEVDHTTLVALAAEPADVLPTSPSSAMRAFAASLTLDALINAVQRQPYQRGPAFVRSLFAQALGFGSSAPIDCDERAYAIARIGNAMDPERRALAIGDQFVPVRSLGVVAVPALYHALLIVEVPEVPPTYSGPVLLESDRAWLIIETTTVAAAGEVSAERLAVYQDDFARWELSTIYGSRAGRGALRWAPHGSAAIAHARSETAASP